MSDPYGNVVPIDASQRARVALSPHESAGLVAECRGLALERLAGALGAALERVEDELFALAEKTKDREAQNDYLDARSQARARRPFIEAAFGKHFVLQYNQRVKGVPDPVDAAPHELMLVDEAELERALALRDLPEDASRAPHRQGAGGLQDLLERGTIHELEHRERDRDDGPSVRGDLRHRVVVKAHHVRVRQHRQHAEHLRLLLKPPERLEAHGVGAEHLREHRHALGIVPPRAERPALPALADAVLKVVRHAAGAGEDLSDERVAE